MRCLGIVFLIFTDLFMTGCRMTVPFVANKKLPMQTQTLETHASPPKETIVLLHGLGRTRRSMAPLAHFLEKEGYVCHCIGYPSRKMSIPELAEFVRSELEKKVLPTASTLHFVTHSMGGIVLRQMLAEEKVPCMGRVVMLAPPNGGSEVIDRLGRIIAPVNGPASCQLTTAPGSFPNSLPPADFPLGIIAGSVSIDFYFNWVFDRRHDGKVAVESTRLAGMNDHIVLPVSHPFLLLRRAAFVQVVYFLKHGQFNRETEK